MLFIFHGFYMYIFLIIFHCRQVKLSSKRNIIRSPSSNTDSHTHTKTTTTNKRALPVGEFICNCISIREWKKKEKHKQNKQKWRSPVWRNKLTKQIKWVWHCKQFICIRSRNVRVYLLNWFYICSMSLKKWAVRKVPNSIWTSWTWRE